MLVVCSAKLIKEISTTAKSFKKFNLYKHSNKSYTKGIFLVEGEDWQHQRAIVRHSFSHESLKKMIPIMNDSINSFLSSIKKQIQ
jgi:cytochrome P450